MDKDRVNGSLKQISGRFREAVGWFLGDKKSQAEGKAQKEDGESQNAAGSAKDTIRETFGKK